MRSRSPMLLLQLVLFLFCCWYGAGVSIVSDPDIGNSTQLIVYYDPPSGHSSPAALGVFVRANDKNALVYYDESGAAPTLQSKFITYETPYIQLDTPFKASRNRTLTVVAVVIDETGIYRSKQHVIHYFVEGSARPFSYGFLVPGIESGGYFIRYGVEIAATARAQVAGGQEFADFFTSLGIGPYGTQITPLNLLEFDPDLQGFEGGFPANVSTKKAGSHTMKHYGFLIPYHNGEKFFGKVVRVDLQGMGNLTTCMHNYRIERYDAHGVLVVNTTVSDPEDACVFVIDLATKHPKAVGFRRGFVGFPYGYLSAGHYSVLARLDLEKFGLDSTQLVDVSQLDSTFGGYSGGFADGSWSCFNPYLTFSGPIGGVRSSLPVDADHLRPYYYAVMLCLNSTAWQYNGSSAAELQALRGSTRTIDLSTIEETLRGFSEALRVGRFAYLSPLSNKEGTYSSKLIRISLGDVDIGTTLMELENSGTNVRTIIDILDLSKKSEALRGYSGLFNGGKYIFLVPFRNMYEPKNGQRGHGSLTRLDMNDFSLSGVDFVDIPTTIRTQVPSFPDFKLRGFWGGFASGYYGMLVPFFNADFNGRIVRFKTMDATLDTNLQELDLMLDKVRPNTYRGYRGGFPSLWQGVKF